MIDRCFVLKNQSILLRHFQVQIMTSSALELCAPLSYSRVVISVKTHQAFD